MNNTIHKIKDHIITIYLFIMLGFFPLYYKKHYVGMGDAKYKLFFYSSVICFALLFLLLVVYGIVSFCKSKDFLCIKRPALSSLDWLVLLYFLVVLVSFLFSDYKEEALMGAEGWNMGLFSQLFFLCTYFFISRMQNLKKSVLYIFLFSTSIVFLLGILHRFSIDPLGMYPNLSSDQILQFLSTIGQSSWYSSFVCTVFPIGMFIFYQSDSRETRIASGIYTALAFMTIVTQNTDSAFLSLGGCMLLLFYISFDRAVQLQRFFEVSLLALASFKLMGIMQIIFKKAAVMPDTLSVFMSQGMITTILLLVGVLLYIYFYHIRPVHKRKAFSQPVSRKAFYIGIGILFAMLILLILFVIGNSNGFLFEKFGIRSENNYLLFNNYWGNQRGFTWKFTIFSYEGLSFLQKLIGVGPDCFGFYNYSIPQYQEILSNYWGNLTLTNAHNEYLTMLFWYGAAGLISYLMMLAGAVRRFVKNRRLNPYTAAFALCITAYMCHNLFCYQQVCCTPFLYIALGAGEYTVRNLSVQNKIKK